MASTYIGALGIGVSNLERSSDFYSRMLGMKKLMTLKLPNMDEEVLGFEGKGASLVLMHYTDSSNPSYQNNPVKVVIYVPDVVAIIEAIRAEGLTIVREPAAVPSMNNAVIAMANDPDGYVVELIQKQ